jgi:long-chain acyl-CoA synthetase
MTDDSTILGRVAQWAETSPNRVALRAGERKLTYGDLLGAVDGVAAVLAVRGIGAGARVGVVTGSTPEHIVAILGAWKVGAVVIGLNPRQRPEDHLVTLRNCGARSLLLDDDASINWPVGDEIAGVDLSLVDVGDDTAAVSGWELPPGVAAIYPTSGTTGNPRAVAHSHPALIAQLYAMRDLYDVQPNDSLLVSSPLSSLSVLLCGPLLALYFGASCSILARYDHREICARVREDRVTLCTIAPAFFHDMIGLSDIESAHVDLSSVRAIHYGATPTDPLLIANFERRFHVRASQGYGSTECPNTVVGEGLHEARRAGSAGRVLPFATIVIEGADGGTLPSGQVGEITFGPNPGHPRPMEPMIGYLGDPGDTARSLAGGRLHMGDLGYLDELGYLFIVGRTKDVINRGGVNIYPSEIERLLFAEAVVLDAVVVGARDERLGEIAVAYVQLEDPENQWRADEVLARVNAQLPSEKRLSEVRVANSLPRDEFGKVSKRALAAGSLAEAMPAGPMR